MPLDGVAGVSEAVHDRSDEGAELLVGPGRVVGLGQRQLTHHVVHVRLGFDEQVGRNVTEDDGVAPLRRRGRVRVDAGELLDGLYRLERVARRRRRPNSAHTTFPCSSTETPQRALSASTSRMPRPVMLLVLRFGPNGGSGAGVADPDAHASGGTADRHQDRSGAVLARVRQQLGGDDRSRRRRRRSHHGQAAGRGRSGVRRARSPARRRARGWRGRRARSPTEDPFRTAAELAVSGRVRSCAEDYPATVASCAVTPTPPVAPLEFADAGWESWLGEHQVNEAGCGSASGTRAHDHGPRRGLCFGWIDGQRTVRRRVVPPAVLTPPARSSWSQINVAKVELTARRCSRPGSRSRAAQATAVGGGVRVAAHRDRAAGPRGGAGRDAGERRLRRLGRSDGTP